MAKQGSEKCWRKIVKTIFQLLLVLAAALDLLKVIRKER